MEELQKLQKLQKDRSVLHERDEWEEESEGEVHTNRVGSLDDQYVEVVGQSTVSHTFGYDTPSPYSSPLDQVQRRELNLAQARDVSPPPPTLPPPSSSSSSPSGTSNGKRQNSAAAKPRLLPNPSSLATVATSNGKPRSSTERATIVPRNELHVAAVGDKRGSLNRPHLKEVEFTSTISNEDSKGGRERDMTEWKHTYIYDECRTQGEREGKEEVGVEGKGDGGGGEEGHKKGEEEEEEEEEEYVCLYHNQAQDVELYQNVSRAVAH